MPTLKHSPLASNPGSSSDGCGDKSIFFVPWYQQVEGRCPPGYYTSPMHSNTTDKCLLRRVSPQRGARLVEEGVASDEMSSVGVHNSNNAPRPRGGMFIPPYHTHHPVSNETLQQPTMKDKEEGRNLILLPVSVGDTPQAPDPDITQRSSIVPTKESPCPAGTSSCVICWEHAVASVCLPCAHLCVCEGCSKLLKECPLCRRGITSMLNIFMDGICV